MKMYLIYDIPGYKAGTIFDSEQDFQDHVQHLYIVKQLLAEGWLKIIPDNDITKYKRKKMIKDIFIAIAFAVAFFLIGMGVTLLTRKNCEIYYVCAPENLCCGVEAQ